MRTTLGLKDFSLNCLLRVSGAIKSYSKVTNKPSCFAIPLCYSSQFILVLRLIPLFCLQIRLRAAKSRSLLYILDGLSS